MSTPFVFFSSDETALAEALAAGDVAELPLETVALNLFDLFATQR
jgi:hypothetical protein